MEDREWTTELRNLFLKYLTEDSETRDARRKEIRNIIKQSAEALSDKHKKEVDEARVGYVRLADDQTLPKLPRGEDPALYTFKEGQDSLVRAGWWRIILEE